MIEEKDFEDLRARWSAMIEFKDEEFEEMDKKLKRIKEMLERTEYNIKHFGER
jgi:hypothetical protein